MMLIGAFVIAIVIVFGGLVINFLLKPKVKQNN